MYKCYQEGIVSGAESFPLSWIIGENLLHVTMWVLAGSLLWPVWTPSGIPLLTIVWAILVIVVQVLLKKHNCSGCYYYNKRCHLGWGKISSAMFAQASGDPKTGLRLAFFYIIPPPLIVVTSIVFAIIRGGSITYWIVLGLYVVLNVATFPIRKKGCGLCAMREVCPGSAAKNQT
jgi:hypothetical protein